jgi:hypothetical protein
MSDMFVGNVYKERLKQAVPLAATFLANSQKYYLSDLHKLYSLKSAVG